MRSTPPSPPTTPGAFTTPTPTCAAPSTPWWTAPSPRTTPRRSCSHSLLDGTDWHQADHYFLLLDYASYFDTKLQANRDYADRIAFGRKCLMNVASAAKFSSDRTIRQYAEEIWHIKPTEY